MGNYTYGSITVFGESRAHLLRGVLARVERRLIHRSAGDKEYRSDNVHWWLKSARRFLRATQHRKEPWWRNIHGPLSITVYGNYSYIEAGDVARAIAEELANLPGRSDDVGCTLLWRDDDTEEYQPNVKHFYFAGLSMETT
ncbi:MAG: hypothetical protein IPP14_15785 [Planctomycetes bacterium]|nr:hypothetical protein [Planctomycetota bacterium]